MAKLLESVVQVVCEWDIGQDLQVFDTRDAAEIWVKEALSDCGIDDPLEELEDAGLVSYNEITIVWGPL